MHASQTQKMPVLVIGLGNFGKSWANEVVPACADAYLAGVCDADESRFSILQNDAPRFTDWREAVEQTKPRLVVAVVPPNAHLRLVRELMQTDCAVLCEKPIALEAQEAEQMAALDDGRISIAENYRYAPALRTLQSMLQSGDYGAIVTVKCHFAHYHPDFSMFYHGTLAQPLLIDVSTHHFDVLRYLTGSEAEQVCARTWGAPQTWYGERPANASAFITLQNGAKFLYEGSLASPVSYTDWLGDWTIETTKAVFEIRQSRLYLQQKENEAPRLVCGDVSADTRVEMLGEIICAVREGRRSESTVQDNLKSFLLTCDVIEAAQTGRPVQKNA